MEQHPKQWTALALASLCVLASTAVVRAQSSDFQTQLDSLHLALDSAEIANAAVRLELDEARVRGTDEWLTSQRVSAITSLVQDVLADSDTRLSMQGNNVMMGWSDGFHLSSADGRFSMTIGGLVQSRFIGSWVGLTPEVRPPASDYDQWRYGFEQPRTQFIFSGHAFNKGLEYYVETGWGRYDPHVFLANTHLMSFRLWDAWLKFKLDSNFSVKIGQFNLPFSRESLVSAPYQLAIEKTNIDYRMGLGSAAAIEFDWMSEDSRFKLALSNGSGALYHGTAIWRQTDPTPPQPALGKDTLYSVTMRHEWKLLGDWEQFNQFTSPPGSERGVMLGLAGHRQNTERDDSTASGGFPEGVFWGVTGDVSLQFDGASFFASVIYERVTNFNRFFPRVNWLATVVQGSTYITNQTELYARWESGGADEVAFGDNELMIMTVGINHYLDGQDLKLSADAGFSIGDVSRIMLNRQTGWQLDSHKRDQVVIRTQLQMMF